MRSLKKKSTKNTCGKRFTQYEFLKYVSPGCQHLVVRQGDIKFWVKISISKLTQIFLKFCLLRVSKYDIEESELKIMSSCGRIGEGIRINAKGASGDIR